VFFGGFPGCERDPIGPHEMVFGLRSATPGLISLTEHQFRDRLAHAGQCFNRSSSDGAWTWRLMGAVLEALSIEGFERVTAVRSHFILPEGAFQADYSPIHVGLQF
jgi:hypothetical protein